jgi:tetratricopeptide (TPR) repeat protein
MNNLRYLLVSAVLLVGGCSRAGSERTADAPLDDELVAVASGEAATASSPADARADFPRQLAQLTRQAEEHERRGYYEHAIAAREELARLLAEHYGADAWEARSARLTLEREKRLHELDSVERAKNDDAGTREHHARELWQRGKQQEAVSTISQAASLAAQVWGDESYTVANLLDQQARWQLALGEQAAAEPLFRQALAVREKVFSRDHPDTIASCSALGLILQAGGRNAEAEPLLREVSERACSLWGETHLEYAAHLNNLAMLLHEMGRDTEAIELMTKATNIRRHALGERHQVVGQSLLNLGTTYYTAQNYAEAAPLFRQALAIFEADFGAGHPRTRLARSNLGLTLMAQGEYGEAEELLRADLEWTRKDVSEKHPAYAEALGRLAALFGNQGRYEESLPLAEQAAAIQAAAGAPDDPRSRQAHELVAKVRGKLAAKPPASPTGARNPLAATQDRTMRSTFESEAGAIRK